MQVERKPKWWPYVALLLGLLIASFWAPFHWKRSDSQDPQLSLQAKVHNHTVAETHRRDSHSVPTLLPRFAEEDSIAAIGYVPSTGRWPLDSKRYGLPVRPSPTFDDLISTFNSDAGESWLAGRPTSNFPLVVRRASLPFHSTTDGAEQWSESRAIPSDDARQNTRALVPASLSHVGNTFANCSSVRIGKWLCESAARLWEQYGRDLLVNEPTSGPADASVPPADAAFPAFPAARSAPSASSWPAPDVLIGQLERLAEDPYSRGWATDTIVELDAFLRIDGFNSDAISAKLAQLSAAAAEANRLADFASDDRLRVDLLRAHWALARRIDRWSATHDIHVAALSQARIASRGEIGSLLHHLPDRSNVESLSADLEAYEHSRDPLLARQIVASQRTLQSSTDELDVALADAVEQHYRNANVRFAVTKEMLNRFVGERQSEWQPVRDRIAGTPVRGQSETLSESRIQLEPAIGRWQFAVEAEGVVESSTTADGGRARIRSQGTTDFTAHKSVVVEPDGVRTQPSVVTANNYNQLVGVTTDFDWLPLFGSYARGRAFDQFRAKRQRAQAEVESKVANRAADRLDERTAAALERAERQIEDRLTGPFAAAGVDLTPIELTTTSQRLVARLRVAGSEQLAAHTPRPRAPADSLASLQVQETALTNAAVSLALDGGRFSAAELQSKLRDKLPQLAAATPLEARPSTFFEFAAQDAVRFQVAEGRLELVLTLVDFEREGRHLRNFVVHAYYVPVVDGLSAELVRDGGLGIEGRLSSVDRARLHSVFKEVLREDRRLPILRLNDAADEQLAGLMITQLVLEDGWLGLAIGPQGEGRTAERLRSLR